MLAAQTAQALVHPAFCGSALTGVGVHELTAAIPKMLPTSTGYDTAPLAGLVFKIERGPAGDCVATSGSFPARCTPANESASGKAAKAR